jgi:hypothetical protein
MLSDIGVDTSIFWNTNGDFRNNDRAKQMISAVQGSLFDLPGEWKRLAQQWDIIVCNNLIPNLAILHGKGVVQGLLDELWDCTRDDGVALIGTIDSHFYASNRHPSKFRFFSQEIQQSVRRSRWNVLGIVERAFVRESTSQMILLDGYQYLILGKTSRDFSDLMKDVKKMRPKNVPRELYELSSFPTSSLWDRAAERHILGAFKTGPSYRCISLRLPFPQSVHNVLTLTAQDHFSFGIVETLLSSVTKPCS